MLLVRYPRNGIYWECTENTYTENAGLRKNATLYKTHELGNFVRLLTLGCNSTIEHLSRFIESIWASLTENMQMPNEWYCTFIKVGLSPFKINFFYVTERPIKMIKNAFYFILKAPLVLKIFKFLFWLFGHVEETTWLKI